MRKLITSILILSMTSTILWGCTSNNQTPDTNETIGNENVEETSGESNQSVLKETNYFNDQTTIDTALQEEAEKEYSFEEPFIVVNPYGKSPLSAVAIFSTSTEIGGTITVKGKLSEDNIVGSFPAEKNHIVPIYGLYSNDTTEVELTLDDGTSTAVMIDTDAVELNSEDFEIEMIKHDNYNFSDLTFVCSTDGYLYAVDSKGDIRWFSNISGTIGVKALSNGHLAVPAQYTLAPQYYKSGIMEIDLLGKVYKEYAIPGGMHHDSFELSNGNLLVLGDRPNMETVEDYVVEIDRETGEVVWELDMAELIDPSEGGSINRTDEDWFHNNAVCYNEESDTLLLSARHIDAIVAVNKTEKTLKWILGDPEGWSEEYQKYFFTPKGDNFEWQYAQHQVSMLSQRDIMCLDNGAGRTKSTKIDQKVSGDDVYSRAVVYHIDEENMTIEQIWQYGKEFGGKYYSEWISGAISLDKDPNNIWITFGSNLYNPEEDSYDYGPSDMFIPGLVKSTHIVQVMNNEPVYKMKLNHLTYRTLRLSAYDDLGGYDVTAQGQYLGNLGVSETTNVEVDITDAAPVQNATITLDPTKLTLDATYNIASADNLQDSYFILRKEDGTIQAYKTIQSTVEQNDEVRVTTTGWISTYGLQGSTYDVYVMLDGTVYNTGYQINMK